MSRQPFPIVGDPPALCQVDDSLVSLAIFALCVVIGFVAVTAFLEARLNRKLTQK